MQLFRPCSATNRSGALEPVCSKQPPTAVPRYGEELIRVTNPLEVLELRLIMEPGLARLASTLRMA